jgi:hypothetical protein
MTTCGPLRAVREATCGPANLNGVENCKLYCITLSGAHSTVDLHEKWTTETTFLHLLFSTFWYPG